MTRDYMNKDNEVMVIFIYPQQKNCLSLVLFTWLSVIFLIDIRKFHDICTSIQVDIDVFGKQKQNLFVTGNLYEL